MVLREGLSYLHIWKERLCSTLKPAADTSWELQFDLSNSSHQQLLSPVQSHESKGLAKNLADKLVSHWRCICFQLDLHDEMRRSKQLR